MLSSAPLVPEDARRMTKHDYRHEVPKLQPKKTRSGLMFTFSCAARPASAFVATSFRKLAGAKITSVFLPAGS
jgi:hypothetical protein